MPSHPSNAATRTIPTVTIRSAAHHGRAVAIPAAIVARPKPSANTSSTAAPSARPIPIPSDAILRLTSSAASSSSRRTSELACSETLFTVEPSPAVSCSVSGVSMASPVDDLGEHDSGDEGGTDDQHRRRPLAALLALLLLRPGPRAELRARGRRRRLRAGRRIALGARPDEARLQL